jgi:hypothetical protein
VSEPIADASRWNMNEFLCAFAAAVLTVLGALFATYVAFALRFVDCCNEADSEPSRVGEWQSIVALIGLVPALGMLVACFRERGRPWRWFAATVAIYTVWGVVVATWST